MSTTIEQIRRVRAEGYQVFFELYCENPECTAREIHLRAKDLDTDLEAAAGRGLTCPLCQQAAKVHWVRSQAEHEAETAESARCVVNLQMYRRDFPTQLAVPLSVITDRLPPTPPGWWDGLIPPVV